MGSVERWTPEGVGGVAVLAVRSGGARARLAALLGRPLPAQGEIAYGRLAVTDAGEGAVAIDEVLVVGRADGVVELHLHGSPGLVAEVLARLEPARDSGPGPRPSLEERAEAAAAHAPTAAGARLLLDQSRGHLRAELESLRLASPAERARRMAGLARRGRRALRLLDPATVALVGAVNSGKSTLFNVLAGEEVAAVTSVPGTTRDALGSLARFARWPVVLVDTAGARDLEAAIVGGDRGARVERAGQDLAREVAGRADLVLELVPVRLDERPLEDSARDSASSSAATAAGTAAGTAERGAGPRVLRLWTMAALARGADRASWGPREVSALEEPEHARRTVARWVDECLDPGPDASGDRADERPLRAGAATPFERGLVERLSRLAATGHVAESELASLLDAL